MQPIWRSGVRIPAGSIDYLLQFFFLAGYAAHLAIRCSNPSRDKRFSSAIFFSDRLCGPSGDPVFESKHGQEIIFCNFFSDRLCSPSVDPVFESQQGREIFFCNFFLTGYAAHLAIRCSNPSRGKRLSSAIFFSDRLCSPSGDPVFESQQGQKIIFCNFFFLTGYAVHRA